MRTYCRYIQFINSFISNFTTRASHLFNHLFTICICVVCTIQFYSRVQIDAWRQIGTAGCGQGRHLRGAGGPSPPKEKEKKKKERKKEKKRKKEEKKKEKKKGTMNNVKLLHIKGCFFPIFQ